MAAATSGASGSRYARLKAHYDLLSAHLGVGDSLLPNTSYANFLKEHEQQQSLPNVVPDPIPDVGDRNQGRPAGRIAAKPRLPSANTIRQRAVKSLDESTKRLKAIEDLMWQHRQEERELKRTEMDIIRGKKQVSRSMKDYESKIAKQQVSETQNLLDREAQHVSYQHKDLHQKKEATKERTQAMLAGRQKVNETTKKFMKTENELSWRYQTLLQSLERKKTEVEQLSQEFESKIRAKEEEQFHLKQELANLAITLNMEAQKRRHLEADHDKQSSKAEKKDIQDSLVREDNFKVEERSKVMVGTRYENQRRELDKSLKTKQDSLKAKHRQGGRDLLDVRSRLQHNSENQRLVAREADHLQLEMMAQQTQTKMKVVEAKRLAQAEEIQRKRQSQNAREKMEWERRFVTQENEARKREHEERLKQLSQLVTHYDQVEHRLFSDTREAEAQRKKQSQVVTKMQGELEHLKRENAKKLKEAAIEAQRAEMALQQKVVRETGNLSKVANMREETLQNLVKHRLMAKEERRMLADEKKEHQRRARIENRTVLLSQTL